MSGPPPLQRVTLWVADAERSLRLYRDVLGLEVLEDKRVPGPYITRMVGYEGGSLRIVHLGSGSLTHGWVGLYELQGVQPSAAPAQRPPPDRVAVGQCTLVFRTQALSAVVARLDAEGRRFLLRPTAYEKREGTPLFPAGRYTETIFFDPDDVPVSLIAFEPA